MAALDSVEDRDLEHYVHGQRLRWAAENIPTLSFAVVGGMLSAFARSTGAPLAVAERRAIVDAGRCSAARPAGGAR